MQWRSQFWALSKFPAVKFDTWTHHSLIPPHEITSYIISYCIFLKRPFASINCMTGRSTCIVNKNRPLQNFAGSTRNNPSLCKLQQKKTKQTKKEKKNKKQIPTVHSDKSFAFIWEKHIQSWLVSLCPNTGNAVFPVWSLCEECAAVHLHSYRRKSEMEDLLKKPPWILLPRPTMTLHSGRPHQWMLQCAFNSWALDLLPLPKP